MVTDVLFLRLTRRVVVLGIFWIASQAGLLNQACAADYWLGGEDPVVQKDKHKDNPADYMDLFKPDAPWPNAAAGLKVFQISTQLALRGTDEQLKTVIESLKARHIGLSIELGVLTHSDRCGGSTEGYAAPLAVEAVAKRISKLGGTLDYISMDEPVTWGHAKVGRNAKGIAFCNDQVSDLADQVAPKIAILQRYFPNIQIGEVDGVNSRHPMLARAILEYTDHLEKKLHLKVAFVHADIAWDSDWRPQFRELVSGLRARGIRVGVICDGDTNSTTDEAWTTVALQRCTDVARDPKMRPDDYVVQTWLPRPTKMLPETTSGTLTNLLKQVQTALH